MRLNFASPELSRAVGIAAFVAADGELLASAAKLDKVTKGTLTRAIKSSSFKGSAGQKLVIVAPAGVKASQIILIGIGDKTALDESGAQSAGGVAAAALAAGRDKAAIIACDPLSGGKLTAADFAANVAFGALLRSYRFDKYRTKEKKEDKPALNALTVGVRDAAKARKAYAPLAKIADGVFLTRDLVSEPANILYPESFAQRAKALSKLGVKVQVLDQAQMKKLGMGSLLGVAQGSANPPRLVALRWDGAPKAKDKRPVAFVGKGVTFDTGGISIKPAGGMEDMKWDMGGAGVVTGLMHALAARKAKVNAVGILGLVENMPSGKAQRPGDVVTTMSGQTIEVINTDAEGRLVLADAMWWCQEKFKPHTMIDLATLTGAIIIALGHHHAGMYANDDALAADLVAAGQATGEALWRMPLSSDYDKQVRSQIADMKNVGGRDAGSITAAQILQRFVKSDVKWAHLDIAGVTWSNSDKPIVPRGGTGFGVRLLDRLVSDQFES